MESSPRKSVDIFQVDKTCGTHWSCVTCMCEGLHLTFQGALAPNRDARTPAWLVDVVIGSKCHAEFIKVPVTWFCFPDTTALEHSVMPRIQTPSPHASLKHVQTERICDCHPKDGPCAPHGQQDSPCSTVPSFLGEPRRHSSERRRSHPIANKTALAQWFHRFKAESHTISYDDRVRLSRRRYVPRRPSGEKTRCLIISVSRRGEHL